MGYRPVIYVYNMILSVTEVCGIITENCVRPVCVLLANQVNIFPFQFQVHTCSPVWRDHVLGKE